jgi:hypothetical protein
LPLKLTLYPADFSNLPGAWYHAPMRGIINIIIGAIFIIGGLTGKLSLRGTGSNMGIVILGVALVVIGLLRLKSA